MSFLVKETQVLYNARGKKSHVVIPYKKYEELLILLEDALDLKAMKEVEHEKTIPWENAKRRLQKRRR